jgi:dolichol-phosphate mannosyltransferase
MTIRDCTSGFRCWRREVLERLPLASIKSDGYAFIVELAFEASRAGFRCTEVPITFVERRQGASKLSGTVIIESAIVPWRLAARPR